MYENPNTPRVRFLRVSFDPLDLDAALDAILKRSPMAPFASVVTPNSDHVARIDRLKGSIAAAYQRAWLCLNDSRILAALAHARGVPLPVTPGSDLVERLFAHPSFDRGAAICVVGGDDALTARLGARYGLTGVRRVAAPMGLLRDPDAMDAVVRAVEAAPARFVFLAIGSPQQEILAQKLQRRGVARGVGLCIGAGLEFLVGDQKRAPRLLRRAGLEWAYRLLGDPVRLWRRYLIDSPRVLLIFAHELLAGPRPAPLAPTTSQAARLFEPEPPAARKNPPRRRAAS